MIGHLFLVVDKGVVFTWGYGFLGNSSEPSFSSTPQKLTLLEKRVVNVYCGLDYYVLFTGIDTGFSKQLRPIKKSYGKCFKVKQVLQSILIADDKEMYMWGKLNHTLYSPLPKKVYK